MSRKSTQKFTKKTNSKENMKTDLSILGSNSKKNIVDIISESAINSQRDSKKSPTRKICDGERVDSGMCDLCGLRFDQSSKKVTMTEKTRETGQTFADVLYGLFHEESLPFFSL